MALPIANNGSGLLGGYLANRLQGLQSPLTNTGSATPTSGQGYTPFGFAGGNTPTNVAPNVIGSYGMRNYDIRAAQKAMQASQAAAGMGSYDKSAVNPSFTWNDYDKALANQAGGGVMPNLNTSLGGNTQPNGGASMPQANNPYGAEYTGFGGSSLTASGNPVYGGGQASGSSGGGGSSGPTGTNNNGNVPNYYAGGALGMGYKPIAPAYTQINPFTGQPVSPAPAPPVKVPTPPTTNTGGTGSFNPTMYVKPY